MIDRLNRSFEERFGSKPVLIQSPGRINLIGEHTDYNEGFVLPAAIDRSIMLAMAANGSRSVRFHALNLEESVEMEMDKSLRKGSLPWANYLLGAIDQLQQQGYEIPGFDCLFGGDIPIGSGLSSSAALVGGAIFGLSEVFGFSLSRLEMAKVAQKVENDFVGVRCGIMDSFANMHGEDGSVLKLDCRSLEHELYPFPVDGYGLVLCNTGIQRALATSEYNLRREQCEEGVAVLKQYYPDIQSLRDVNLSILGDKKEEFDPVIYRRCRYVLEENSRVLESCNYLVNNGLSDLGKLLYKSHEGLSDLYEVSCRELDVLVDIARQSRGVLGARMMGGGFGGCTINLVEKEYMDVFIEKTLKSYQQMFGSAVEIHEVQLREGVRRVGNRS